MSFDQPWREPATYPDRVNHLVLYGTWARFLQDADYPAGLPADAFEALVESASAGWGKAEVLGVVGRQRRLTRIMKAAWTLPRPREAARAAGGWEA